MQKNGRTYVRRLQIQAAIQRYEQLRRAILATSRAPIANGETSSLPPIEHWDINAIRALILLNEEGIDGNHSEHGSSDCYRTRREEH